MNYSFGYPPARRNSSIERYGISYSSAYEESKSPSVCPTLEEKTSKSKFVEDKEAEIEFKEPENIESSENKLGPNSSEDFHYPKDEFNVIKWKKGIYDKR